MIDNKCIKISEQILDGLDDKYIDELVEFMMSEPARREKTSFIMPVLAAAAALVLIAAGTIKIMHHQQMFIPAESMEETESGSISDSGNDTDSTQSKENSSIIGDNAETTATEEADTSSDTARYSIESVIKINTYDANFISYYNENLDSISVNVYLGKDVFAIKSDTSSFIVGSELETNMINSAEYEIHEPAFKELESTPFEHEGLLMDNELYCYYSASSTDLYSTFSEATGECNLAEYKEIKRYYLGGFKYGIETNSYYDSDSTVEYYMYEMDNEPYLICYMTKTNTMGENSDSLYYVVKLHFEEYVDYEIAALDVNEAPETIDSYLLLDDHSKDTMDEDAHSKPSLLAEGTLKTGTYRIKDILMLSESYKVTSEEALSLEESVIKSEITVSEDDISWICNEGAPWIEASILFTAGPDGKYYWGVQHPLYLCCDDLMIDDGDILSDSYQSYAMDAYDSISRYHLDRSNIGYTYGEHWYETEARMHMYIMDGNVYLVSYHENMVDKNTYERVYDFVVELEDEKDDDSSSENNIDDAS